MAESRTKGLRWTRVALIISLALNLAVAGLVLGNVMRDPPWDRKPDNRDNARVERPPSELRELAPLPFIAALSKEQRGRLLQDAKGRSAEIGDRRDAVRNKFEELLTLLRAEEFDGEAVTTLLREMREASSDRHQVGEALLVRQFEAMGGKERAAYADRLDRSLKRSPQRR